MRTSRLITEKKEKEILRQRKLTPEERLREQVRHNSLIRKLFFPGLRSQGFSQK